MSTDALLSRLDGVRRTGTDRWIARCPAHDDRRPSLSVRELEDGRTLLHDFAGCSVEEVLGALGLTMEALFPPRPLGDRFPRERRPFDAASILQCIAFEAEIASLAADNLANGLGLTAADRGRLRVAASRLRQAAELAHG